MMPLLALYEAGDLEDGISNKTLMSDLLSEIKRGNCDINLSVLLKLRINHVLP